MVYTAAIEGVSVSAIQDLYELLAPADAAVEILSLEGSQEDLDASEFLQIQLRRVSGAPTSGSGGGTITPNPLHQGWPAAGSTVERNNTTQLSGGTNVVLVDKYWQVLNDFLYKPVPEERIVISPSTRLVVELPVAPSGATNMSWTLAFREIGG